jgi:LPS export ABC transporter protein LptC
MNKTALFSILFVFFSAGIFFSCSNDVEKVNAITDKKTYPEFTVKDMHLLRTDSGKIVVRIEAPVFDRYQTDDSYIEFPKGVKVYMYDEYPHIQSSITANYAKQFEAKKIWEARNNVVAVNFKGEKLNTEQLFWDENKKIIYSEKFTRVITPDGVFYGQNGFEADQSFTRWKLLNTSGTVNVKDE